MKVYYQVYFTIVSGNINKTFKIKQTSETSCEVVLDKQVDYETMDSYMLKIVAHNIPEYYEYDPHTVSLSCFYELLFFPNNLYTEHVSIFFIC